jgi:hypothetical protein
MQGEGDKQADAHCIVSNNKNVENSLTALQQENREVSLQQLT